MPTSAIRKPRNRVAPDMNVTPLVDVVLVLLIIFMVVTPQMENRVAVELPGVFNADPDVKSLDPLEITVAADGSLTIEKEALDLAALERRIQAVRSATPERRAVLRADQALSYAKVRPVFTLLQKGGFPGVALVVAELRKEGAHGL